MNAWSVLEDTRWQIIEAVASGTDTLQDIATATGTSVANVSQHLRLLEALGYVHKQPEPRSGRPGKPKNVYSLEKELAVVGMADHASAARRVSEPSNRYEQLLLRTVLIDPQHTFFIAKFLLGEDLLQHCSAVAYLRAHPPKIELFVLADDIKYLREAYSNVQITDPTGEQREIVCWTHTRDEVIEGVEQDDGYYRDLIQHAQTLYDPDDKMRWKNE
jgi:DNA-binding transcriptional ArsR family regulator